MVNYLLQQIIESVNYAQNLGLQVNAGHGLNRQNVQPIAAIQPIQELNIGHALIADAVFMGLEQSVGEYRRLMNEAQL